MDAERGATVNVKSGAVTFRVTFTVCPNSSVLVPLIVNGELPPGVLVEVVTVMVEFPDPEMAGGEKDAEVPDGRPAAVKVTASAKPYNGPTLTV